MGRFLESKPDQHKLIDRVSRYNPSQNFLPFPLRKTQKKTRLNYFIGIFCKITPRKKKITQMSYTTPMLCAVLALA